MNKITPYSRQSLDNNDIKSVVEVLKSDFLTQGKMVPTFETNVLKYCNSKFAVACNSATSALHASCLSLGLGKGDIMWTSPISFVASSNAALYCGAEVDFIDIDIFTNNISIEQLEEKLKNAKKNNKLPKIVMPVHMAGLSCDMKSIFKLSKKYKFKVIEDASHAIGGKYLDSKVGSCKYSDITVFSFHPVKIITSGEGGMALTNSKQTYKKLRLFTNHGIIREKSLKLKKEQWRYRQTELGYNYRMSDIHASLGNSQLKRVEKFVYERNRIAEKYNNELRNLPILRPMNIKGFKSSYHLYIIKLQKEDTNLRQKIYDAFIENNFNVQVHYLPIYYHPYYKNMNFKINLFPIANSFYKRAISIPIFPGMKNSQIEQVIKILKRVI
ncbi:UDP-4-amino-4,6-dideoxy-N-acetyl-beta-L-altrosamine transaminase [Pelagibacteraceae bacterium]|nr:UDP-4-amino-4,6-dideoxy-N-acetyl-beta-L-altrosamine transaminase [Pelagibacteraceae bacterium]